MKKDDARIYLLAKKVLLILAEADEGDPSMPIAQIHRLADHVDELKKLVELYYDNWDDRCALLLGAFFQVMITIEELHRSFTNLYEKVSEKLMALVPKESVETNPALEQIKEELLKDYEALPKSWADIVGLLDKVSKDLEQEQE